MLDLFFHSVGLCGEYHPTLSSIIISQPEVISSINYFKYVLSSKSKS